VAWLIGREKLVALTRGLRFEEAARNVRAGTHHVLIACSSLLRKQKLGCENAFSFQTRGSRSYTLGV
jgi:hypothetical protein